MISVGSVVRIYPGPPDRGAVREKRIPRNFRGELAQLGERLVCNQEVTGSSPVFSTTRRPAGDELGAADVSAVRSTAERPPLFDN